MSHIEIEIGWRLAVVLVILIGAVLIAMSDGTDG